MTVGILSLAGIPPAAGFFGKFFLFKAAVDAGLWWLAAVGILFVPRQNGPIHAVADGGGSARPVTTLDAGNGETAHQFHLEHPVPRMQPAKRQGVTNPDEYVVAGAAPNLTNLMTRNTFAGASFAAVDVNKATVADLDGVKGVGPAMSKRILDERKKGNFKDWGDFMTRVKGVGPSAAGKLSKEGLTVDGAGYQPAAAKK